MALFVFGAGATRGAAFVDPKKDACLPPLDADFFTQLQRVHNVKHLPLISKLMEEVVELFGPNFDVTMETVFATVEHTIRMLSTTGESRDYKRKRLLETRNLLKQTLAVVLEDSLTVRSGRRSSVLPKQCEHHQAFVEKHLAARDEIVTFNYDCLLDDSLRRWGNAKWNARYGYGVKLGPRGKGLTGDRHWQPGNPASQRNTVRLLKLHGSLHFREDGARLTLKQRPYTRQNGDLRFAIIPPESDKSYDQGMFKGLWQAAAVALHRARHIVVIGYSLPASDLHSTALFRTAVAKQKLKSLVVVNPDRGARRRIRSVLQRGLDPSTRVISFDYFEEFVGADRSLWAV